MALEASRVSSEQYKLKFIENGFSSDLDIIDIVAGGERNGAFPTRLN
jgi:hypothetical protein